MLRRSSSRRGRKTLLRSVFRRLRLPVLGFGCVLGLAACGTRLQVDACAPVLRELADASTPQQRAEAIEVGIALGCLDRNR
jgi:hypothetical protein